MAQSPFGNNWSTPPQVTPSVLVYAGFWWRVLAFLIDCVAFTIIKSLLARIFTPGFTISYQGAAPRSPKMDIAWIPVDQTVEYNWFVPHVHWHGSGIFELLMILLPAIYCIAFESSPLQATPGKIACRMRVTDLAGQRITPVCALIRYLAKYLSLFMCGFGFLMVGWNPRKRALHDYIAGTLVVRRGHSSRVQFTSHF